MTENELRHHGIIGQKWGVRRFQNPDGSLTPAGMKRYDTDRGRKKYTKKANKVLDNYEKLNSNQMKKNSKEFDKLQSQNDKLIKKGDKILAKGGKKEAVDKLDSKVWKNTARQLDLQDQNDKFKKANEEYEFVRTNINNGTLRPGYEYDIERNPKYTERQRYVSSGQYLFGIVGNLAYSAAFAAAESEKHKKLMSEGKAKVDDIMDQYAKNRIVLFEPDDMKHPEKDPRYKK